MSVCVESFSVLGWAWLPKALSESRVAVDGISPLEVDMMFEGVKLPISLWCQQSKNIKDIKHVILKSIREQMQNYAQNDG